MRSDLAYRQTAAQNRGAAAEVLANDLMERIFGSDHVHRNVLVLQGKKQVGEIDVLVVFGDRAVVVESKAKGLTLTARQGRLAAIERDFFDAIQKAHDQAYRCSQALLNPKTRLQLECGSTITLSYPLTEIYPVCVVAEHYAALSFQVRQLLVMQHSTNIRKSLVLDIFSLDTVTEFLSSPLRFLNYLELRALHGDNIQGHTELSLLGLHLHQNLWPIGDADVPISTMTFPLRSTPR